MRKIIQISTTIVPASEITGIYHWNAITALYDDGSLWKRKIYTDVPTHNHPEWIRIPPIPQDTPEKPPKP